jgi:aspartate/methionine/tyrosine aminotransferase
MIIEEARRLHAVSEYYFSRKLKEIQALRQQGHDIINLGIGSPDLIPDQDVIKTLERHAGKGSSHGYQPYTGIAELREAIAEYLETIFHVTLEPNTEILPLMGSKEGIMHISLAFLNPGDKVLIPNPGYPTYASVSKLVEADVLTYDLSESTSWEVDLEQLQKLPLDDIKLMWLNYPNMPTGAHGSIGMFKALVQLARKHKFLLVNDNPYAMIHGDDPISIFQIPGAKEVALELNSMSKSHNMAGWRLGWVAGDHSYLKMILKVKSNMDSGMFLPIQRAAVRALQLPLEWHKKNQEVYRHRRMKANSIFDLLQCTYDSRQGGMFAWGKAPDEVKDVSAWVDEILEKAEVFITPGHIFGSRGDRYIRISLCSSEHLLEEAAQRISSAKLNNKTI